MPRPRRIYYNNAVYHVTVRANNRETVFNDTWSKEKFLETLGRYQKRYDFVLYAYVIMPTHFHLVIETSHEKTISKVMHGFVLSLSCSFRRRYKRTGHVWESPFHSRLIEDGQYLNTAVKYVENNPVRAGLIDEASEYRWGSAKKNSSGVIVSTPEG